MTDKEKVIRAVDSCFDYWLEQHRWLDPLKLENVRQFKADALTMLKKQEPKPPIVHENSYGWKFYYCQNCEKEFYQNRKQAYCDKCGQEVKWE